MKKVHIFVLCLIILFVIVSAMMPIPVQAQDGGVPTPTPDRLLDESLPGEPPFPTINAEIPYWMHNCSVKQETVEAVDAKLQGLDESRKVQTVILCMPYGEVKDGVLYAITFYNHMQLGHVDYQYRDRGFVWLVQVDQTNMKINYAVGEGLPKLDAGEIDTMRNNAITYYTESGDLDASLSALTDEFVNAVTTQYPELTAEQLTSQEQPATTTESDMGITLICLVVALILIIVVVLLVLYNSSGGGGYYGGGYGGSSSSSGGSSSSSRSSGGSFGRSSGGSSGRSGGGGGGARRGG